VTPSSRAASILTLCAWAAPAAAQSVDPWRWGLATELRPADGEAQDYFGRAVALAGDTAVIGAYGDDLAPNTRAGSAYVYARVGGTWVEQTKLAPSDGANDDHFGFAVAMEGDAILVGAHRNHHSGSFDAGAVYVFEPGPSGWTETAKLIAGAPEGGAELGYAVAVDGDTLVAGAPGTQSDRGAAHVFRRDPSGWSETAVLVASDSLAGDRLGAAVAVSGDVAVVGAPCKAGFSGTYQGVAYVFERGATSWAETARFEPATLLPGDSFGAALAASGDTLLVGAHERDWMIPGSSQSGGGVAYAFVRNLGAWTEQAEIKPNAWSGGMYFGFSLDLEGDLALIGAPLAGAQDEGFAYAFLRDGTSWLQDQKLKAKSGLSGDNFGSAVALDGESLLVGAHLDDSNGPFEDVRSLAFDPALGRLLAVDTDPSPDALIHVDPTSGNAGPIGLTGLDSIQGLAYDPTSGTLYGSHAAPGGMDDLVTIHAATGATTLVGPTGFKRVLGLAFDAVNGRLYGIDDDTDELLRISKSTGKAFGVGSLGFDGANSLAFDANSGRLYAISTLGQDLYSIDPATGAGTLIGSGFGTYRVHSLAFDAAANTLLGVDYFTQQLHVIDTSSGQKLNVGPLSGSGTDSGAAHAYDRVPSTPVTFCTAGTSSAGCRALLSAAGSASATAATGFDLSAAGLEGGRAGLFLFGSSGRRAAPWGNGTSYQCVVPPVSRTPLLGSGGTPGACDGALAQDLNSLWCPTCPRPGVNPGAGNTVQTQLWYRDPQSTSTRTTGFSDALELAVGP
jgi:hypothetical protein